ARRLLGALVRPSCLQGFVAGLLRVGVVDGIAQVVAPEDHDKAMLAHRLDKDFDTWNADLLQLARHLNAALSRRPAGAAVGDQAGLVEGAKVAAHGHVFRPNRKMDAKGFQHAAANAMVKRIVTEQSQMAGAAAGSYAGKDRNAESAHPLPYTGVQVGRACGFQFRLAAWLQRQST